MELAVPAVSIRAPTRGAMIVGSMDCDTQVVSIRAPTRGAILLARDFPQPPQFQSAPPREGRSYSSSRPIVKRGFQSAPPREGRCGRPGYLGRRETFQSAPPREGRCQADASSSHSGFNPRPHERGDRPGRAARRGCGVSIRAPTRGAMLLRWSLDCRRAGVSIRAPTRGAMRHRRRFRRCSRLCFNPRPREGREGRYTGDANC